MRLLGVVSGSISAEDRPFFMFMPPFTAPIPRDERSFRSILMSFSLVTIGNMALAKCGSTKQIHSLTPGAGETVSQEAFQVGMHFELAFRAAARALRPKCLETRRDISGNLTTTPAFGYAYAYSLPTDCIAVTALEDPTVEWKVEGRTLLTDTSSALISMIRYTLDTDVYDDLFVEALVYRLAAAIAPGLLGSGGVEVATMLREWHERVSEPQALAADSLESSPVVIHAGTWKDSRL
jgi:hypothetical protein